MKVKDFLRRILVMGIVALFLGAIGSAFFKVDVNVKAVGTTIYVDDDNVAGPWDGTVSHPYQNMTSGLEYASFGDTVHVFSGMYVENVVVNKSITLIGESKPAIDGMGGTGIDITLYDDFVYGVTVDGFDITNCSYGIHLVMENIANDVTDLSVTIGDIILSNNTIRSDSDGIFADVHNVGVNMYGNSSVVIEDFCVSNNVISSSGIGINVNGFHSIGIGMFNNTAFSMGSIEITGNTLNSTQQGIYLYQITDLGEEMYDNSSFTMGSILVNENNINSGDYGIAPWNIYRFGNGLVDNSSFTMGNIEFCRNTINSTKDAIGFSQFTYFGTDIYGNSSFSMGNILVNDNTLHSIIWLTNFGTFGAYLHENSSCTMGSVEFRRNIIYNDWADAITFYNLNPFGYEMYDYSLFKMENFSVNNNVIASNGGWGGIFCSRGSDGGFGINVYDNAVAMTGNFEFAGNNISFTIRSFNLWWVRDVIIRNNIIWNSTYGIDLTEAAGNNIYHNNFINNTVQAHVTPNYNNTWDNGYPSGGNYWSEYTDIDNNSGPYQNITGTPDGIWDNPYIVNENNTDRYPFANLYDDTPPTIGIPARTPSGDILPDQEVTVKVNVTDNLTGVKNVTLYYTIDDGLHWNGTEMLKNPSTELYEANIPGQEYGTTVRFKTEAFDYAGNNRTRDGVETYYIYQVVPEFPSLAILLAFTMTTLLLAVVFKKKRTLPTRNKIQLPFFCLAEY